MSLFFYTASKHCQSQTSKKSDDAQKLHKHWQTSVSNMREHRQTGVHIGLCDAGNTKVSALRLRKLSTPVTVRASQAPFHQPQHSHVVLTLCQPLSLRGAGQPSLASFCLSCFIALIVALVFLLLGARHLAESQIIEIQTFSEALCMVYSCNFG